MNTLRVVYCRSLTIGGILIRAGQWFDQWNHCGIVTPEGTVINAEAFGKGVIEEPLEKFLSRYSTYEFVDMPIEYPEDAIEYARSKLGCKYDYMGIFGFITGKFGRATDADKFHCTYLLENSAVAGRNTRKRFRTDLRLVTPSQSFKVI